MKITDSGETVEFKTLSPFFEREKAGQKNNTVRVFRDENEEQLFISSLFSLSAILVTNPETKESFKRLITDVSCFSSSLLGYRVYIITWEHRHVD